MISTENTTTTSSPAQAATRCFKVHTPISFPDSETATQRLVHAEFSFDSETATIANLKSKIREAFIDKLAVDDAELTLTLPIYAEIGLQPVGGSGSSRRSTGNAREEYWPAFVGFEGWRCRLRFWLRQQ